jgi:uncharacterized lipoprotein YajG
MTKKIFAMLGTLALLSACETASQKVVSGSAATSSSSGSASSSGSVQVQLIKNKAYLLKPNKQLLIN